MHRALWLQSAVISGVAADLLNIENIIPLFYRGLVMLAERAIPNLAGYRSLSDSLYWLLQFLVLSKILLLQHRFLFYYRLVWVLRAGRIVLHHSFAAWHLHCVQASSGVWTSHQHVRLVAILSCHRESYWVRGWAERCAPRDTVSFESSVYVPYLFYFVCIYQHSASCRNYVILTVCDVHDTPTAELTGIDRFYGFFLTCDQSPIHTSSSGVAVPWFHQNLQKEDWPRDKTDLGKLMTRPRHRARCMCACSFRDRTLPFEPKECRVESLGKVTERM